MYFRLLTDYNIIISDHPEDEMPLLDDMTTTVRPTPGFLLTTTTEEPTTITQTRRECVENDQLYPDGALIKTEKPCVHCYCMKGDIVCVVQECGTPMENEGKNCTSLPPREGQCCPDTYICEGDELATEISTKSFEDTYEDISTMQPPRRVSIEGSGYRNEPDELPYTETPTAISELEGSGEEQEPEKQLPHDIITPEQGVTTEEGHLTTLSATRIPMLEEADKATTEPDKGLNTVPSGFSDEESSELPFMSKTTLEDESRVTEPSIREQDLSTTRSSEEKSPTISTSEITTIKDDLVTETAVSYEQSTMHSETLARETSEPYLLTTKSEDQSKTTETSIIEGEHVTSPISEENNYEPSITESTTADNNVKEITDSLIITEQSTPSNEVFKEEITESYIEDKTTHSHEDEVTGMPIIIETVSSEMHDDESLESTKSSPSDTDLSKTTEATVISEQEHGFTEAFEEATTIASIDKVTESTIISEQNTVSGQTEEESSSDQPTVDETPLVDNVKPSEPAVITENVSTETTDAAATTMKDIEIKSTESPHISDKQTHDEEFPSTTSYAIPSSQPDSHVDVEEETLITTEPTLRKEDESNTPIETSTKKEEEHTTAAPYVPKETDVTSEFIEPSTMQTITPSIIEDDSKMTTANVKEHEEDTVEQKEPTTESFLELSTFAHITKSEEESTPAAESDIISTTPTTEKLDLPLTTTINPEENEIDEDVSPISSPGRIPGEGDCLLNGITYKNDSAIPSTNKCHSGCRCVSSIIKCDPIICSLPPEYMDNCQLTYDTPNSCCPTYVCDQPKETIPPQPHSQMSGTESPIPSPTFECEGDQCEVTKDKQPPITTDEITSIKPDEKLEDTECGFDGCGTNVQAPVQPLPQPEDCTEGKCTPSEDSCDEGKCQKPSIDGQPGIPSKEVIPDITVPTCEGESCTDSKDQICKKEGDCETPINIPCAGDTCELKPEVTPDEDESKTPESPLPCDGQSCTTAQDQPCNKEGGCEVLTDKICQGEHCESPEEISPPKDVTQICDSEGNCKKLNDITETAKLPCDGDICVNKPDVLPSEDVPKICENADECKETKIPEVTVSPCDGDKCESKPEIVPTQSLEHMPDACENEDDCKQINIPETAAPPCEGDSCTMTDVSLKPGDDICSEESGCKKPEVSDADCAENNCRKTEITDIEGQIPSECTSSECMQNKPISPSQETTDATEPITEPSSVSKPAYETATEQREQEMSTEPSGIDVTDVQKEITELPDIHVSHQEDIITTPSSQHIDATATESADSESPSTDKVTLDTETTDFTSKAPEIATDQPSSDSPVSVEYIPEILTEEPVIATELPEVHATETITQDVVTETSTTRRVLPTEGISTEIETTEAPKDEQSSPTYQEIEQHAVSTEQPSEYVTEPEIMSTRAPQYVDDEEKIHTQPPESPTEGSMVPEIFTYEETTLAPKISETESEETKLPVHLQTTEASNYQTEDEATTEIHLPEQESKITTPEISQDTEIFKTTEVPESHETELPQIPDSNTQKTQEMYTEAPVSTVSESQDDRKQQDEANVPTKEDEAITASSVDRVTEAEEPITTIVLDDSSDSEKPTKAPELNANEQESETSTKKIDESKFDEDTKKSVTFEAEDKETYTESPEAGATLQEKYDAKTTEPVPTEQDSSSIKPHYETKTDLPLSPITSNEEIVTVPELSVTNEEKIMTESPLSLVTHSQMPVSTTLQQDTSSESDEKKTETPLSSSTLLPEITEEVVTDKPESHVIEPQKTITETPEQQTTELQMVTTTPELQTEKDQKTEVPALTESPAELPHVTDLEAIVETETELPEKIAEKETTITELDEKRTEAPPHTESSVPDLPEISTKEPQELETKPDKEYPLEQPHEEPSTKIPVPIFSDENLSDVKVTDSKEPSVTEEYDGSTKLPEHADEDNEIKPNKQETIESETEYPATKLPEVSSSEQSHIESTESTIEKLGEEKEPEDNEIITEIPEIYSEKPNFEETTSELVKPDKDTTESPEILVPEQDLQTEAPEQTVTKEHDTESPELYETTQEQKITESAQYTTTKYEEIITTEAPAIKQEQSTTAPGSLDTDTEKRTTESSMSEQEEETRAPFEVFTNPQESDVKPSDEVTKSPDIPSSEEDMLTVLPIEQTVQAEPVTPKQDELETTPPKAQDELETTPSKAQDEHDTQTDSPELLVTGPESLDTRIPEPTVSEHGEVTEMQNFPESTENLELPQSTESTMVISSKSPVESEQTSEPQHEYSETTPYLVELEEHTHRISDEMSTIMPYEEPTSAGIDSQDTKHEEPITEGNTEIPIVVEKQTESTMKETEKPDDEQVSMLPSHEKPISPVEQQTTVMTEDGEKITESSIIVQETTDSSSLDQEIDVKLSTESQKDEDTEISTTPKPSLEDKDLTTEAISNETEQPEKVQISSTARPLEHDVQYETTAPEEEFIPAMTTRATTAKVEEEITTLPPLFDKYTKPEESKPSEMLPSTSAPEIPKPGFNEQLPTDEVPSPEDDAQFPPSDGYGHDSDYGEEDQAFGPGTCRYGGKVYVSAQQIPRDDPCDFCFCFRSDIICLQQSCPPPIHGCHEEPIQGFCCPRYECPVSMATSLNVTTTTTTTTTTLPPHFLPHAYKGAAQRRGCQIKGHTYKVGEVVRASSGPCLHCT